jgi:hypothetical protein
MTEAPLDQDKIRGTFTKQPDDIYSVRGLKSIDKLIWQYLNTHKKTFHPSIDLICRSCDCSRQTAITSIKRLEERGMLKVTRQDRGRPNLYTTSLNQALPQKGDQSKLSTTPSLNQALPPVPNLDPKKNKKNNKENNNDRDSFVDNFKKVIPEETQEEIKELSNQIHPYTDKATAGRQLAFYLKLERANPGKVTNSILSVLKVQNSTYNLPNGVTASNGKIVFDRAYRHHFEATVRMVNNSS